MERKTCPSCGAPIAADLPDGLCPACLLSEGLKTHEPTAGDAPAAPCPACGRALGERARFCAHCGAAAVAAATDGDPVRAALEAKLRGQYRVIRLLGHGGMGAVYLARDLTLDREVAIKVMKTGGGDGDMYDRLRREAKTAAKLSHPNIVPLHAFGEVEGTPYFVMGFVRGESLANRLRREGRLREDDARRIVAEVADALDHAHRQGIVHRDVKPDNVLLDDESGRALLTDFGVAKALGRGETHATSGHVVGTPHYMSPEQASGRGDLDGRSDIYSLGVMAYAMLSGRLPFEGGTAAEILTRHLTQDPPPLRSLAPSLSDPVVQTIERCLAKDPARRWPDARSLKLALGAVEDSFLPDSLQAVQGQGMLASALAFLYILLPLAVRAPRGVLYVQCGLIVFVYLFVLGRLRREGIAPGRSQRAIWTEPAWWPFWYPRALRRPGNVWDRLPASARSVRWWVPAFWVYVWGCIFFVRPALYYNPELAGVFAFVILWVVLTMRARRELKRKGLGPADAHRVMISTAPSKVSFWARPHIAAVLAPEARTETRGRSDSPHDQLQSILREADELSGPLRPLGTEAAAAARQLLVSIEQADREIAKVARSLEPGEPERLAEKIEALTPGGDEDAALRVLLEKQLDLLRGLASRIEGMRQDRSRRVELLRTLALHVASLRARSVEPSGEVRSLSERVRALCDDISRQSQAGGVDALVTLDRRGEERP